MVKDETKSQFQVTVPAEGIHGATNIGNNTHSSFGETQKGDDEEHGDKVKDLPEKSSRLNVLTPLDIEGG